MKTNAVDFSQECPCIWKIQNLFFKKVNLYYDEKQKVWARKIKVEGRLWQDGWFYPYPNLFINYKIKLGVKK